MPQELPYGTSAASFGLRGAMAQAMGAVMPAQPMPAQRGYFLGAPAAAKTVMTTDFDQDDEFGEAPEETTLAGAPPQSAMIADKSARKAPAPEQRARAVADAACIRRSRRSCRSRSRPVSRGRGWGGPSSS